MKMGQRDKIRKILYALLFVFVLLAFFMFFLSGMDIGRKFFSVLAGLGLLFLVLGCVLLWMSWKLSDKKLRRWLVVTGFMAVSPFVFSILHNFFYALEVVTGWIIFEWLHVASFIFSLLIAPIVFLVGAVYSIILMKKK